MRTGEREARDIQHQQPELGEDRSLAELYEQYFAPQPQLPVPDHSSLLSIYDEDAVTFVTQSSDAPNVHMGDRA